MDRVQGRTRTSGGLSCSDLGTRTQQCVVRGEGRERLLPIVPNT